MTDKTRVTCKLFGILIAQLSLQLSDPFKDLTEIFLHLGQHLDVFFEVGRGVLESLRRQGVTVGEHGVCLLETLQPGGKSVST